VGTTTNKVTCHQKNSILLQQAQNMPVVVVVVVLTKNMATTPLTNFQKTAGKLRKNSAKTA